MTGRLAFRALALMGVLGVACLVSAEEPRSGTEQPLLPQPEKGQASAVGRSPQVDAAVPATGQAGVVGTVESVSRSGALIRVRDELGEKHLLTLTQGTRILWNREAIPLSRIKRGAEVLVSYRVQGQQELAEEIELLQDPSARRKTQAKPKR